MGRSKSIHSMARTRLYNIWQAMKSRCNYKKDVAYKNYGGRGISICPSWDSDFMCFYTWAIENGYNDDLSIDRIDVNGNYEPQNCKFSTCSEQSNNTRVNVRIEWQGKSQTVTQWARELGISRSLIYSRLRTGANIAEFLEQHLAGR